MVRAFGLRNVGFELSNVGLSTEEISYLAEQCELERMEADLGSRIRCSGMGIIIWWVVGRHMRGRGGGHRVECGGGGCG